MNSNARTNRRGGWFYGANFFRIRLHASAQRAVRFSRNNLRSSDGSDRRQTLSAKAQRRNRFEVIGGSKLARRMTAHRERQVLRRYSGAVIDHFDEIESATLYVNRNAPGAGIDCVFDQLFH